MRNECHKRGDAEALSYNELTEAVIGASLKAGINRILNPLQGSAPPRLCGTTQFE